MGLLRMAWLVGGYRDTGNLTVPTFMLERTAVDLVSLIVTTARQLPIDSPYTAAIGLTLAPADDPIVLLSPNATWGNYEYPELSVVERFQRVSVTVPAKPTYQDLIATARDVALDCISQAGNGSLSVITS